MISGSGWKGREGLKGRRGMARRRGAKGRTGSGAIGGEARFILFVIEMWWIEIVFVLKM